VQYTVILVHDAEVRISILVPAVPTCFSVGNTAAEALVHVWEAIRGRLDVEASSGRQPPVEASVVVTTGVAQAYGAHRRGEGRR
jgi:predicted RNase H-like HicB family nuclease